jgi:anti-sigma factor RsiW
MNCYEARQQVMVYLDREGEAELLNQVRDHIGTCPACADWFARRRRWDQALGERLAAGECTPALWQRILKQAGIPSAAGRSRRRLVFAGLAAAAAVLVAATLYWVIPRPEEPELALLAAQRHQELLDGVLQPDLRSSSDQEVDRYLKAKVPFRVHCPPRTDVNFAVRGAGVCLLKDRQQAAYIIGHVDKMRVSILVLDRSSLAAFPQEQTHWRDGKSHYCQQGSYQMVSGLVADNVVVVIGKAPRQALEKLLHAYGTYHEG